MTRIKINSTDVILDDYGKGKGKVIISDDLNGSFSYTWGAMGGSLIDFIQSIDSTYFANKLIHPAGKYVFSPRLSVKSIRRYIKNEMSYELPWYQYMSGQKEMREQMRELEFCSSEHDFIASCHNLPDSLLCTDMTLDEERDFKGLLYSIFCEEPWHFIENTTSKTYNWLLQFHSQLSAELSKTKYN